MTNANGSPPSNKSEISSRGLAPGFGKGLFRETQHGGPKAIASSGGARFGSLARAEKSAKKADPRRFDVSLSRDLRIALRENS